MKKVQVLLSTYNGEKFLETQLNSLIAQKGIEISILVRDDGSNDKTREILNNWKKRGFLDWYDGENLKAAKSFFDLIMNAGSADYYAFCDQDDIWEENKLKKAIQKIESEAGNGPALYYSDLIPVDEDLRKLPKADIQTKVRKSFSNTLIYNYATGCTMVFNKELLSLVQLYRPNFLVMHDHWIYLICAAVNGKIVYDEKSYIFYRQHGNNVVGYKKDIRTRLSSLYKKFLSNEREKSLQIKELYKGYKAIISPENLELIEVLLNYDKSIVKTFKIITNSNFKNGLFTKDILFWIALITRRF